ncbi:MAG: EAL domain-containing protein [Acidobacteriaceae bacterium]
MKSDSSQSFRTENTIRPKTILRIIRKYALFGALWVFSSDIFVYVNGGESRFAALLGLLKGLLFIATSAVFLYWIINRHLRNTIIERDSYRERLQDLSLNGNDILILASEHGQILEVNDRAISAHGYTEEELCTMSLGDLVNDPAEFEHGWNSALQSGSRRCESVHRRADGSTFPVEYSARRFDVDGAIFIHTIIRDITDRHDAERQLLALKNTYAALFQTNQCIAGCSDRDQIFHQTCDIAVSRTKLKLAWVGVIDRSNGMIVPVARAGQAADFVSGLQVSINAESPFSKGVAGRALLSREPVIVNDLWNSDGFQPWIEKFREYKIKSLAAFPIYQGGQTAGVLVLYSDDSHFFTGELSALFEEMSNDLSLALDRIALRSEQVELQSELNRLKQAVEQSQVTVVIADRTGAIEYVNPAFTASSGYSAEDVVGKNPRLLKSGKTTKEEYASMWRSLASGESWTGEFHNRRKDGSFFWEEAVISPVKNPRGEITHFIGVKQDVTAHREAAARARFLAFHDALTELPNRSVAKEKMSEAMMEADRAGGKAAVIFIDVDNLKRVNDSLGHGTGDRLIQALVYRLQSCMNEGDLLSRLSGDEFLLIIPNVKCLSVVDDIAQCIRRAFASPLDIGGIELSTTVSIGAAIYPDDGDSFDELYRQADLAMYCAKRHGRDTFRKYAKSMETDGHEYLATVNGLRKAVENEELVLYYQPQIHLETGEVRAVEALLRWNRPGHGLMQPGRFISVAEDSGLIVETGNWVIREACRQAAAWRDSGMPELRVALNLSALQLRREGLDEVIAGALKRHQLRPELLELELTESALVHDDADVAAYLKQLKAIGVEFALDDFGTGYSNFTYLRRFELNRLKIDQSFVRNITSRKKGDVAIIRSIVQLARNFGLETIAEGVETTEALRVVRRAGCDYVQGFFLAIPMPAAEIPLFISERFTHQYKSEPPISSGSS